jgi:hypothetical protein
MSEKIIAFLVHFVTHVIDLGGYAGIAALMGIESACIPLPSEIIMPFAGYLVYTWATSISSGRPRPGPSAATWARSSPIGSAPRADGRWSSATANGC